MTKWRMIVIGLVLLSLAAIVVAELPPLSRLPWQPERPFLEPTPGFFFHPRGVLRPQGMVGSVAAQGVRLLGLYLLGVIVVFVAPRRVRFMADVLHTGPQSIARSFILGLALAILVLAVGVLASFSLHTFPVPFILIPLLFLVALGGVVAITFDLGRGLLRKAAWYGGRPLLALALGSLLVFALTRIPIVGWLVLAVIWLTGAGIALTTHFGSGQEWSLSPLLEEGKE
jgi:hypothetical protein